MGTTWNWIAAAIASLAIPSSATAQQLMGESGGWVVLKMDDAECWMLKGTANSLFGISLTRESRPSVIFTVKYVGTPPAALPMSVQIVNAPFAEQPRRFHAQFTLTKKKGEEYFYQAPLTDEQLALVQSHKFITLTELPTNSGRAANITAAIPTAYDQNAISIWRRCAANL